LANVLLEDGMKITIFKVSLRYRRISEITCECQWSKEKSVRRIWQGRPFKSAL